MNNSADATSEATLPIREISRITGVNSVTLRAWERRYGLIKPLRTHKGHRLYRNEDIRLINNIQAWLARGLAIGKISELLTADLTETVPVEDVWQDYLAELQAIVAEVNWNRLESFFSPLLSVYPPAIIADRLIAPVLGSLNQPVFGNNIKRIIFSNHLSEYLLMLVQRQRHQIAGNSIGIIQLTTHTDPLLNVFLHYGVTMAQHKSELIGLISAEEVLFAVEKLRLNMLVIYNNAVTSLAQWEKSLLWLAHKISIPIVVGGSLAQVAKPGFPAHLYLTAGYTQQDILVTVEKIFSSTLIAEAK